MNLFLKAFAIYCLAMEFTLLGATLTIEDSTSLANPLLIPKGKASVIRAVKQVVLPEYPNAYNPSLLRTEDGLLLIFRSLPDPQYRPFISDTVAVWLDEDLHPISKPQILLTRQENDPTPQQSEDARIFSCKGQLYLVYNDNEEVTNPSEWSRRDMFITKVNYANGRFSVGKPQKIIHPGYYDKVCWQKNWVPFEWNDQILLAYTINPHEIVSPNFETGVCDRLYSTNKPIDWHWGKLRGGTPGLLVDGEYLAFFHSPIPIISESTESRTLMHYFMGAYTYKGEPPFELTRISPYPISYDGFYSECSALGIRCIYPGGYTIDGSDILLAYGRDDHEIWIATINKEELFRSLVAISKP